MDSRFSFIEYKMSNQEPKARVEDFLQESQELCDDLKLDEYLHTPKEAKQSRKQKMCLHHLNQSLLEAFDVA